MPDSNRLSRRNALKMTFLGTTGAIFGASSIANAACKPTPAQTAGPFYPEEMPDDTDLNLTRVKGRSGMAQGQVAYILGLVKDQNCNPVQGARVEIWQACSTGRYNHSSDPNTAVDLDPNFQYTGHVVTNKNGWYRFKTIVPGAYPATPTWVRPPHIHFKVSHRGFHELTSQIYFEGSSVETHDLILGPLSPEDRIIEWNRLNVLDRVKEGLTPDEQQLVTVKLYKPGTTWPIAQTSRVAFMDMVIQKIPE